MKVVSLTLSPSSGIFQNPLSVSNSENIVAPDIWGNISSRVGRMYRSRSTAWFRRFRLTHIFTYPLFLGTGTIGAHHSVGSVISSITPHFTILSYSAFALGSKGTDSLLAVVTVYGKASAFSLILTGVVFKSPTDTPGECATLSIHWTNPRAAETSRLSRLLTDCLVMKNSVKQ